MLTSLQNPLVKQIRKLHQAKCRRSQQRFLLEGTHLLQEALAAAWPLETVCYTPSWEQRYSELLEQVDPLVTRIEQVSPEVLQGMATTVQPDGIVATALSRQYQPQAFHCQQLGLVLETLQDPGNLGTIIRTAAAAGAEGLLLSDDSADLESPKVLRASAGQWFRLPMTVCSDLQEQVQAYQQQGFQIVATLPTAPQTYWELDLKRPTLILLGNEGAGLSPALARLADHQVTIPLAAGVESLNVAIAAALLLYEVQRQRRG
jgi:RNA methyltransferase, TrmH family